MSRNYKEEDMIDIYDNSIDYPFYLITPFRTPGYAVVLRNEKFYVKPIRNDPFQRYDELNFSSFCHLK